VGAEFAVSRRKRRSKSCASSWAKGAARSAPAWPNGGTENLVALGDSVAAGEGISYGFVWDDVNDEWDQTGPANPIWATTTPATDNNYEVCHQSGMGYSSLFRLNGDNYNVYNMACTGAKATTGILQGVDDKEDPDDSSTTDVTAQLDDGGGNKFDAHSADVVTLTLGANDIDFGGWLLKCYGVNFEGACDTEGHTTTLEGQLDNAKDDLRPSDWF
jgi:hypothetical protein